MTTQPVNAPLAEDLRCLHQAAETARARAHAPYSSFHVGAALRTSDGRIITAGNVENVVYGSTMCTERAAIFRAVAEGYTRFDAIAIAIGRHHLTLWRLPPSTRRVHGSRRHRCLPR